MDNYDILRELDNIARTVRTSQPFYTAAEYVPEAPSILKSNGGPVDACWSASFHGVVINNLIDLSKFELDLLKYIIGAPDLVNYLSCHDNERILFLLGKNGNLFDDECFCTFTIGDDYSFYISWRYHLSLKEMNLVKQENGVVKDKIKENFQCNGIY